MRYSMPNEHADPHQPYSSRADEPGERIARQSLSAADSSFSQDDVQIEGATLTTQVPPAPGTIEDSGDIPHDTKQEFGAFDAPAERLANARIPEVIGPAGSETSPVDGPTSFEKDGYEGPL